MYSEKQLKEPQYAIILDQYEFISIDNQSIIFSPFSLNIHFLDELSTIIWNLHRKEGLSIRDISKEISTAFNIPFDNAYQDVKSTIENWVSIYSDMPYIEKKEPDKQIPILDSSISYPHHIYIQLPSLLIKINSNDTPSFQQIEIIFEHLIIKDITLLIDYEVYISKSEEEFIICLNDRLLATVESSLRIPVMLHRVVRRLAYRHNDCIAILHAGGICYEDKVIVFPAVGRSGKSTLIAALIQSGFNYLNDDVLPLLKNCLITPIPVNLRIRSGSWKVLKKWYPEIDSLEAFGGSSQCKYLKPPSYDFKVSGLQSRFLITPKYNPQHVNVTLQKISTIEALSALIVTNISIEKPLSKNNVKALIDWVASIECYSLEYNNLDLAIEAIKNLVEAGEA